MKALQKRRKETQTQHTTPWECKYEMDTHVPSLENWDGVLKILYTLYTYACIYLHACIGRKLIKHAFCHGIKFAHPVINWLWICAVSCCVPFPFPFQVPEFIIVTTYYHCSQLHRQYTSYSNLLQRVCSSAFLAFVRTVSGSFRDLGLLGLSPSLVSPPPFFPSPPSSVLILLDRPWEVAPVDN